MRPRPGPSYYLDGEVGLREQTIPRKFKADLVESDPESSGGWVWLLTINFITGKELRRTMPIGGSNGLDAATEQMEDMVTTAFGFPRERLKIRFLSWIDGPRPIPKKYPIYTFSGTVRIGQSLEDQAVQARLAVAGEFGKQAWFLSYRVGRRQRDTVMLPLPPQEEEPPEEASTTLKTALAELLNTQVEQLTFEPEFIWAEEN